MQISEITDLLLPDKIKNGLKTSVFGKKNIQYHTTTGSTNTDAETLAFNGAPEGTIVIAENQTKGRGRMDRTWFSPEGMGIYLSIILRPHIKLSDAPKLTITSAVVLADVLINKYNINVQIKWPNDILVNGKKLSGILTSLNIDVNSENFVIVGMGINVNTLPHSMPEDIKNIATSIIIETGEKISRVNLVRDILETFEKYYNLFLENKFDIIAEKWKIYSGLIGKHVKVDVINNTLSGEVIGIDDSGFLILKDKKGIFHEVVAGDIIKIES